MQDIIYQCRPATQEELATTVHHLRAHTEAAINMQVEHTPFAMLAYQQGQLVGSIIGKIYLNWLHLDLVWVAEAYRGKGVGKQLIEQTINTARHNNLDGIEVWTQSWQAPEFYLHLGFHEFALLEDFIPRCKRHALRYMLKAITPAAPTAAPSTAQLPLGDIIRQQVKSYFHSHGESLPSSGLYDRLLPLFEKPLIEVTLEATKGNQIKAAHVLGINRNTLRKKMLALGITGKQEG